MNSVTKITLAGLTTALLVVGLAACNRGPAADGGAASGQKITLSLSTLNNPFFVEVRDGAKAEADKLGVQLDILDAQNDSATQANQLATAATNGSKAVIVNAVDSDAAGSAVSALNKADIPVVAVDRTVNDAKLASFIASDNVAGGTQAAQLLAEAISKKGSILVLQGVAGTSASRDRGQGFTEGLKAFPDITVAASQTANFDRATALNVTTNLLQAHPDIVGIFAENDEMALGAIQALGSRAGTDVKVVAFDGTDDGLKAIKAGTMVGTIAQQPGELGKLAVDQAVKALKGQKVDATVPVKVVSVTSKNVDEFLK
jgi:ribose transport system substrate-binding protein